MKSRLLLTAPLMLGLSLTAWAGFYNAQPASLVIGQTDFVSKSTGISVSQMNEPNDLAFDASGDLWVADSSNRVLEFKPPFSNGMSASLVLGQTTFTSSAAATTQSGFNRPIGLAFDAAGNLWVADGNNNRVLRFDPPFSNGMNASLVIGQPSFISNAYSISQSGFRFPTDVFIDPSGNLWVSDINNSRVLEFAPPFSNGMNASLVLGQPGFMTGQYSVTQSGLAGPLTVGMDSMGALWVADGVRVLGYEPPFSNGMNATWVLGQPSFTANMSVITQNGVSLLDYGYVDSSGDVWVSDNYVFPAPIAERVLEYRPPFSNGMNASLVLGPPDFTTGENCLPAPTASNLCAPAGITKDKNGNLWVVDSGHYRVLMFANLPDPLPPSNLAATSLGTLRIGLSWTISPSTTAAAYDLYWDSGTGSIDYTVLYAGVAASTSSWITPVLTGGVTYKFGVRAKDQSGVEESNTNVVASAMAQVALSSSVSAAIVVPQSGHRVWGNRVTVMAGLIAGTPAQTQQALFQYKPSTGTAWLSIPAADAYHSNPAASFPYFIHWDVTGLVAANYDLRAVASNQQGQADPAPPTVTIAVDPVAYDIDENAVAGQIQTAQAVNNNAPGTIQSADEQTSETVSVAIATGSLSASTVTVTVVHNPASAPAAQAGLASIGAVAQVTLSNGQSLLLSSRTATLSISYPDADNDGIVDGTRIPASSLQMYVYDTASGQWTKQFGSSVDTVNHLVVGYTPHFSLFGLFAPAAGPSGSVSSVQIACNPLRNGCRPMSFQSLPAGARLRIYAFSGALVKDLSADGSGNATWDGANQSGQPAASGVYFVFAQGNGTTKTFKVAIER